jgi:hypothetical protein
MQIGAVEDTERGLGWPDAAWVATVAEEEARVARVIARDSDPDAELEGLLDELEPPVDPWAVDDRGPVDQITSALRGVDATMARVLRLLAQAGPRDGLSVRRQVGLIAGATGADAAFLDRAVEVLRPMGRTQSAFDDGLLGWGQVRGIVLAARPLSVAQRELLDLALAGTVAQGRDCGEPDRVVEVAQDLAARIDAVGTERDEAAQERAQSLAVQLGLDGWAAVHGQLAPENAAALMAALDAAADDPVAAGAPPAADDDGRVLPPTARPARSRSAQWAEALGRIAAWFLGHGPAACTCATARRGGPHDPDCASLTTTGRAKPRAMIITPFADLRPDGAHQGNRNDLDDLDGLLGSVTARLLWRRGTGRRRISRTLTRALVDDADLIALLTDGAGMPLAIGDCYAPITTAMRRAVAARDQGCRAPGCSAPAAHCDVHHVIPREQGGPTALLNMTLMCRPCHTRLRLHRWQMTLEPDGTLKTRIGRRTFTTRARLAPPPRPPQGTPDAGPDPPTGHDPPTTGARDHPPRRRDPVTASPSGPPLPGRDSVTVLPF